MKLESSAQNAIILVLLIAAIAMVVGQQLGQPILLGYVVTGSMAPTLHPGDGFVALPPAITGEFTPGDVVTFDAQRVGGGGLTTHRVVDVTSEGYITRGDANPFADQDGNEPPVTDAQIVAVALQINGEVVRIPRLGDFVLGMHGIFVAIAGVFGVLPGLQWLSGGGIGTIMVSMGILLLGASFVADLFGQGRREAASRTRRRPDVVRASLLLAVILLLILVPTTASMAIPSGVTEIGIVSSSSLSDNPTVIGVGESEEFNYTATNIGLVPKVLVIEPASEGVVVDERVLTLTPRGGTAETVVTVTAPQETGFYLRFVSERHYLHVLPVPMIMAFHSIHPLFAMAVINVVIGAVVAGLFVIGVGIEPLRLRSVDRNISMIDRIRREYRRWF